MVDTYSRPTPLTPPAELSTSGSLVNDRFSQAQIYGDAAFQTANELISNMALADYSVGWTQTTIESVSLGGLAGLNAQEPSPPSIGSISINVPGFSIAAPQMPDVDISIDTPPDFNVTDPGFAVPAAPNVQFPTFSENSPQIGSPNIPTAPQIDLPAVPSIAAVSIPAPPEYNLPDFEGAMPVTDLTPPAPMFAWNEAEYDSDVKAALADKLLAQIISGGSGLDAATEQAIYDRATARQELEHNQQYDEALNFFSSRGWRIPPGALSGRLLEVSYKISQTREDLNNDILIQQSKLAQENTHFIIDRAIGFEKNLMDYTNQYQQRAFEAAKFAVEAALIVYQAKVEAYKAELEAYKTQAEVFKARISAEIAKAELYKAQIEGVKAGVEVQKILVEAYKAQVESVLAYIEVYKAEMEGARIAAEIDKTKIEAFRNLVEAYKARVQAVTARYEAYQAQIAGEVAKAQMYEAQVRGYTARVEAYKARAQVEIAEVTAVVELTKGKVEAFRAEIDKYKAQVEAAVEQTRANVEVERLEVSAFEAQVRRYGEELDTLSKIYLGQVEYAKAQAQIAIASTEAASRESIARASLAQSAVEAAAKVSAQLAAAAMGMVSATTSIGYSEGRSDSTSRTMSESSTMNTNHTIGVYTSHTYSHSD